ncbi:MAG: 5-(carboxyamino)imidazole ribonucleotide synthase [Armatimonadota bacterium]
MRIGVLGGGQLGWMLAMAGYRLGLRLRFLDPNPEAPAGMLAPLAVGELDDPAAVDRFADGLDLVTYELEQLPVETAARLAERLPVAPSLRALEVAQDRLREKQFAQRLGIPTAPFAPVTDAASLESAVRAIGLPAILKTCYGGYDGKGQQVLRRPGDLDEARPMLEAGRLILEGFVPFGRELSLISVRDRDGEMVFYPLVENEHSNGILACSLAPAPGVSPALQREAERCARALMEALDYVGTMTIELFDVDGRLVLNEIAPRVHNSGHWTIEGAETSQFENHLRAIAGLPLGSTGLRGSAAMVNLVGEAPPLAALLGVPGAAVHLYGKEPRPGRKLGHVTLTAGSAEVLAERLAAIRRLVPKP